jgi:Homeodomain-like domain
MSYSAIANGYALATWFHVSMPRRSPFTIELSGEERVLLEAVSRRYTAPYRDVVRARIILLAAQGLQNKDIAARLALPVQVVSKWRKRFAERRMAGLQELPRRRGPPAPCGPPSLARRRQVYWLVRQCTIVARCRAGRTSPGNRPNRKHSATRSG